MWSLLIFRPFKPAAQIPQVQVLQGFPAFRLTLSRIPPRHSQTTRATNCATPGYEVEVLLRLWSVMWSLLIFRPFKPAAQIPQVQVLQGFPAFRLTLSRIPPRHSQTTRATNCATPGYEVEVLLQLWSVMWSTLIFRLFLPAAQIPQVQALQGFPAFLLASSRIQARHSQTTRAANCAIPVMLRRNAVLGIIQHLPPPRKNKIALIGASPLHAVLSRIMRRNVYRLRLNEVIRQ